MSDPNTEKTSKSAEAHAITPTDKTLLNEGEGLVKTTGTAVQDVLHAKSETTSENPNLYEGFFGIKCIINALKGLKGIQVDCQSVEDRDRVVKGFWSKHGDNSIIRMLNKGDSAGYEWTSGDTRTSCSISNDKHDAYPFKIIISGVSNPLNAQYVEVISNEGFKGLDIRKQSSDREVIQITHRDYKKYLLLFNLPEDHLAKIRSVVDIGAGFSNFSEEARKKFPTLQSIAVDPIYEKIKINPSYLSADHLEKQESILFDFSPEYRSDDSHADVEGNEKEKTKLFAHFVQEVIQNQADYVAASHQDLPLENNSADLVLASNSIIRKENNPDIINKALQECLRILNENGEIRITGHLHCFKINNPEKNIVELWDVSDQNPNGLCVIEYKETGHISNPKLMEVFIDLEKKGVKFYIVISHGKDKYGNDLHKALTLILRKDDKKPEISVPQELEEYINELRELHFTKTDGFNIPATII